MSLRRSRLQQLRNFRRRTLMWGLARIVVEEACCIFQGGIIIQKRQNHYLTIHNSGGTI